MKTLHKIQLCYKLGADIEFTILTDKGTTTKYIPCRTLTGIRTEPRCSELIYRIQGGIGIDEFLISKNIFLSNKSC